MTDSMYLLHQRFRGAPEVRFVSHTLTPDSDTGPVLDEFARLHRIAYDQWKRVTGPGAEIYDLGRKSYFVDEDLGVAKGPADFLTPRTSCWSTSACTCAASTTASTRPA